MPSVERAARAGYPPRAMLFQIGDKEVLVIIAVFLFVTVGVSAMAAISLSRARRWLRRRLWG